MVGSTSNCYSHLSQVIFNDEEGVDAGGVRKEYFQVQNFVLTIFTLEVPVTLANSQGSEIKKRGGQREYWVILSPLSVLGGMHCVWCDE